MGGWFCVDLVLCVVVCDGCGGVGWKWICVFVKRGVCEGAVPVRIIESPPTPPTNSSHSHSQHRPPRSGHSAGAGVGMGTITPTSSRYKKRLKPSSSASAMGGGRGGDEEGEEGELPQCVVVSLVCARLYVFRGSVCLWERLWVVGGWTTQPPQKETAQP